MLAFIMSGAFALFVFGLLVGFDAPSVDRLIAFLAGKDGERIEELDGPLNEDPPRRQRKTTPGQPYDQQFDQGGIA